MSGELLAADAVVASWVFRLWPTLGLIVAAFLYHRGWKKMHRLLPERFPTWRAACFYLGLMAFWLAISSPLDAFAGFLLTAHMVQHLLLTMVAPPLIWLGAPYLPLLSALPKVVAREGVGPFLQWPPAKRLAAGLTHPVFTWLLFNGTLLIWHFPAFYERALLSPFWHEIEHLSFFLTALLFWWPVMQPWPSHARWPRWAMVVYLLFADLVNTAISASFAFYDKVIYSVYARAPRLFGTNALDDQSGAGSIMWVAGSLAYLVPAGVIVFQILSGPRGIQPGSLARASQRRPLPAPLPALRHPRWWERPWLRRTMQVAMFGLALLIVLDGLLGPQVSPLNLAGVLPWTHWRAFTVFALLVAGNFFCYACPFVFFRDIGRKFLPARWEWPRWLRSKWPAIVLLLLFFWAYEVFALWDSPRLTAFLIMGYFGAAFLVDGAFKGASFCKYLCPIGQFHFVQSLVSPLEVKVNNPDVCRTCRTYDCIRGNAEHAGCGLHLFQPRKAGNMDCNFCLDCVQACPHGNAGLAWVVPGRDLYEDRLRSSVGRYEKRRDIGVLVALLVFAAFVNAAGMVAPVVAGFDSLQAHLGLASHLLPVTVFFMVALGVIPALLLLSCISAVKYFSGSTQPKREIFSRYIMALVPLGAMMWAAHFLFHFVTGLLTPVPVIQRLLGGSEISWGLGGVRLPELPLLELLLLDLGLLWSLYVIWRLSTKELQARWAFFIPWASVAIILFVAGVWIVLQPMEMRGTFNH